MRTNRLFLLLAMVAGMSVSSVFAQNQKMQKPQLTPEQRIEKRVEVMQRKLMLDDKTAAKFAPLYKEYLEAMKNCMPDPKEKKRPENALTDAQIDKQITDRFAAHRKMLDTQEKYYQQFKKILTMRQVETLFNTPCHSGMNKDRMKSGHRKSEFDRRMGRPESAPVCPMHPNAPESPQPEV
ncbi:MAG: hypothetical protein PUB21_09700 [Bacteroidales bacterium]|nr:hypothetical protein [Bacteroidales bacterium]